MDDKKKDAISRQMRIVRMKLHHRYNAFCIKLVQCRLKRGLKWLLSFGVLAGLLACHFCGVFLYLFATDYFAHFTYPLEGDVSKYVQQIRDGKRPDVDPINVYNYTFLLSNNSKCKESNGKPSDVRLLLLVKSAMHHATNRIAIRQSWGWEKRFSDVRIRTVFLLGVAPDDPVLQASIEAENVKHGDIVQSNFFDSYYNNTIKTMQGFRWAVETCSSFQFAMFADDDMYVSIKNVLRYIRNPKHYPTYLTRAVLQLSPDSEFDPIEINDSPEVLFSGYVFFVSPLRTRFSKWHMSLQEYPFSRYPPFVAAGSFILSHQALLTLYYTSMYTQHFRFDDVFLGLVAKKAGIVPSHSKDFRFWKTPYNKDTFKYIVAMHGYENVQELLQVWTEQRTLGNA